MSQRQEPEHNWWTLSAVCGATFVLLVDITIVQLALPSIHDDLHASFTQLQGVLDAYALSLASLLLTYGTLADRFGRKRVFVAGVAVFTLASLLCGVAQSGPSSTWRSPAACSCSSSRCCGATTRAGRAGSYSASSPRP